MPEWSNGAVSKTVNPLRGSRVRIPVFPQSKKRLEEQQLIQSFFFISGIWNYSSIASFTLSGRRAKSMTSLMLFTKWNVSPFK